MRATKYLWEYECFYTTRSEMREDVKTYRVTTQSNVDAMIDLYIKRAIRAEERRDKEEHESESYWRHHDIAIKWHEKARLLMPKGS